MGTRLDRIELCRIFMQVVDSASFTRAAASLGLPRSTVSAAISELERRVGARLLHRTTRRVAATADGAAFYALGAQLVAAMEEAENLFRDNRAQQAGIVRVDVPGRIGRLVIAPALPDFLDSHPLIDIELGVTDRTVNLVEERVDCVLRVGPLPDSSLIARHIGDLPLINVASPAYLQRHGTPHTPDDLAGHMAVRYASPAHGGVEQWEWIADGKLLRRPLQARVTVNNAEAYIACCLAGLGLIQIPAYDVRQHLAAGELVAVMPRHRAPPLPITLLYPHRQHLATRVRLFADWLDALLRREIID